MFTVTKMRTLLIALFACICISSFSNPPAAFATNAHQDHPGACAKSTTSISKGVSDLVYNGVAGKFASKMGIKSFDGSVAKQLKNQLVVGKIATAVTTNNTGCDGHGGTFSAGKRTLYKGERVIVKVPAKYGKDACGTNHSGCKPVTITVSVVLPASCWNLNTRAAIKVTIYVKVHKKAKKHTKKCGCKVTPDVPVTPAVLGCTNGAVITTNSGTACQGSPSTETAKVTQDCKAQTIWNGSQCVSYVTQVTIQVNANCSQVVFMNGDNNVVLTHDAICSSTTTTVTPPPSCNCTPQCPAGTTGTFPNCQVPPVTCPSGSTPSTDGKTCVKNGTPPDPVVSPAPGSNPTPVGTVGSNQCYWDHAGTYNGHQHASGDAVSSADFVYAGNVCPTGATDFS